MLTKLFLQFLQEPIHAFIYLSGFHYFMMLDFRCFFLSRSIDLTMDIVLIAVRMMPMMSSRLVIFRVGVGTYRLLRRRMRCKIVCVLRL